MGKLLMPLFMVTGIVWLMSYALKPAIQHEAWKQVRRWCWALTIGLFVVLSLFVGSFLMEASGMARCLQ